MRFTAIFSGLVLSATILAAPVPNAAAADAALMTALSTALEARGIDVAAIDTTLKSRGIDVRAIAADPMAHKHLLTKRASTFASVAGCVISQVIDNGLSLKGIIDTCGKNVIGSLSS